MRLLPLLLFLLPSLAAGGTTRYHGYSFVAASGGSCPSGTPGQDADGLDYGISTGGLKGFKVTICAEEGETLSGTGTIRACVYEPSSLGGPGVWAYSPEFSWDLSTAAWEVSGKRCISLSDVWTIVDGGRVYLYPDGATGVSGGTNIFFYLRGVTP